MTSFVGAEYVIATMLIEKAKKGISHVSIDELGKYGICVQHTANSENLDAVFLTSKYQLFNAIYDFSDYFSCEFDASGNLSEIYLNSSKNITDLEFRFIGYLSDDIYKLLIRVVDLVA
ncbi:MAG: hypothetical protein MSH60_02890 [Ruminococcus sp.]|nr:hypothetical protein [Ruminococcus sp.]